MKLELEMIIIHHENAILVSEFPPMIKKAIGIFVLCLLSVAVCPQAQKMRT